MLYDLYECLVMFRVYLERLSMFYECYLMFKCLAMLERCFFNVLGHLEMFGVLGMFNNVFRVLSGVY